MITTFISIYWKKNKWATLKNRMCFFAQFIVSGGSEGNGIKAWHARSCWWRPKLQGNPLQCTEHCCPVFSVMHFYRTAACHSVPSCLLWLVFLFPPCFFCGVKISVALQIHVSYWFLNCIMWHLHAFLFTLLFLQPNKWGQTATLCESFLARVSLSKNINVYFSSLSCIFTAFWKGFPLKDDRNYSWRH